MAKYTVFFHQIYEYEVEAENEDKAINIAEENFAVDVRSPIANTVWDEVEVLDEDDNEVIHGYS